MSSFPPAPKAALRRPLAPAAFSVSARVAMQLGRESIASTNTAILELVKNAYDADAECVRIRFFKLGTPDAFLVIEDNGSGMTEDEIRNHWLCIGTANKQDLGLSRKNKRVQTGEKGLGRLGLDRLSRRTLLQTKRRAFDDDPEQLKLLLSATDSKSLELDIDWERYNARGERLETIEHEVYELDHLDIDPITEKYSPFKHGTRLILRGLKDTWTDLRIRELKQDLALTLSPFGNQSDFSISIEAGNPDVDGIVHPNKELLNHATWQIQAAIENAPDSPTDELVRINMSSNAHDRQYSFGPVRWQEFTKHSSSNSHVSKSGPLKLILHVFIRDKEAMGDQLSGISNFLQANQGIRIYRDGFRIKPYGDPKGTNDWLALSAKRAQNPAAISRNSWKVAHHQVVGAVLISRQVNKDLVDQTNREGLVDGPAMNDLRMFAQRVIGFFEGKAHEDYVAQNPPQPKPKDSNAPPKSSLESVEKILAQLAQKATDQTATSPSSQPLLQEFAEQTNQALDEFRSAKAAAAATEKAQADEIDELKDELRLTTSLASLGILAASFGHERVKDAVLIRSNIGLLKVVRNDPNSSLFSAQDENRAMIFLEEGAERIESFAKFALDHVLPSKRRGSESDIVRVIKTTLRMFEPTTRSMKVCVQSKLPSDAIVVPGWQAGWESVIANLLINSLHFLRPRKAEDRIIHIHLAHLNESTACITFEDNGTGLEAGTATEIFRPGFSTRRDEDGLQEGTGLGLTLVKSFITSIGGSIVAKDGFNLKGATFEVIMPAKNLSNTHV